LAVAFNNLASHLSEQGKLDEALDYAQQALTIRQQLAQQKPERFNPELARAFNNLANRLSEQGKLDEALDYVQQALTIYQQLAIKIPLVYLSQQCHTALFIRLIGWLTNKPISALENPKISDKRQEKAVNFHFKVITLMLDFPQQHERASELLSLWKGLDMAQQQQFKEYYFLLNSYLEAIHLQCDDNWRNQLQQYKQQRMHNLPYWLIAIAKKLNLPLF
ncbi:MAG: tetratricopeptide repeat protein, partial [Agitococcus sp.]|nr:tetratricopeptide repeat protein [Agitococcus sp.]